MFFFRKKISAHDLGNLIYAHIRYEVMSQDSPLFHSKLISQLEENPDKLPSTWILELLIGGMFGALLSIEKRHKYPEAGVIVDGMKDTFLSHAQSIVQSLGISDEQTIQLVLQRFQEYYESLNNRSGAGSTWHLGKAYYWNILGRKKEEPKGPMHCSSYILKFTDFANSILKKYKLA